MSELQQIVIGLVLFAAIITGMLNFSGDIFQRYGSDVVNQSEYSKLQDIESNAQNQRKEYQSSSVNESREALEDIEEQQFLGSSSSYQILLNVYQAGSTFTSATAKLVEAAPGVIPAWMQALIAGIITVVIVFATVRAILGGV